MFSISSVRSSSKQPDVHLVNYGPFRVKRTIKECFLKCGWCTSLVSVTFNQDNLHSFPHLSKYGQFWSHKSNNVIPNLKLQNGGLQTEFPSRKVGCKIKAVIWKRFRRSEDGFITTSDPFTLHTARTYSSQSARCSFTSLQYEIYLHLVVFRSLSVYPWGHESVS